VWLTDLYKQTFTRFKSDELASPTQTSVILERRPSSLQDWIARKKRSAARAIEADGEVINAYRYTTPFDDSTSVSKRRPVSCITSLVLLPQSTSSVESSPAIELHETLACPWFLPKRIRFQITKARAMEMPTTICNPGFAVDSLPMLDSVEQLALPAASMSPFLSQSTSPNTPAQSAVATTPTTTTTTTTTTSPSASPVIATALATPIPNTPQRDIGDDSDLNSRPGLSPTTTRLRKKTEVYLGGTLVPIKKISAYPVFHFAIPLEVKENGAAYGWKIQVRARASERVGRWLCCLDANVCWCL
jgi:hypothetical protein